MQKGVHELARSVKQIQVSLRRAERKIEADGPGIGFASFAMKREPNWPCCADTSVTRAAS